MSTIKNSTNFKMDLKISNYKYFEKLLLLSEEEKRLYTRLKEIYEEKSFILNSMRETSDSLIKEEYDIKEYYGQDIYQEDIEDSRHLSDEECAILLSMANENNEIEDKVRAKLK